MPVYDVRKLVLMAVLDDGPRSFERLAAELGPDVRVAAGALAEARLVRIDREIVAPTPAATLADRLLGGVI